MTGQPGVGLIAAGTNSHAPAVAASGIVARFEEAELLQRTFWTVPETAFMCRVGVRTLWRSMADPRSGFPAPRRIGRRTLLARVEVLKFMEGSARP